MSDIAHLLAKHRKEMIQLDKELKKEQRRLRHKEKLMNRMVEEALRANCDSATRERDVA